MEAATPTVEHEPDRHRFVARFPQGDAELTYQTVATRTLDLTHTFVPAKLRGHGIAEALVRAALAYARQQSFRVIPTCPYVSRWLERHPEQRDLVTTRASAI